MASNLDRFKKDLAALITSGKNLELAMQYECAREEFKKAVEKHFGKGADDYLKTLPDFKGTYQSWYSEALALLRQLLPDRLPDFIRHYEKPKTRKELTYESYRIEDYFQGLQRTRYGGEKIVGTDAALPHFQQQLAIVKAAEARFESSLFDMRQLVQADLFDTELDAADALAKYKFSRAAGALAGVVLERHLSQVCSDRQLLTGKKNPGIADFNETLKSAGAIDTPQWRFIQHLADIRNMCDHSKTPEPTQDQVVDLINGVKKTIKSVF